MSLSPIVGIILVAFCVAFAPESAPRTNNPSVLSSPLYPCSQCHATLPADRPDRKVNYHADKEISGHGEPLKWCFDCHDAENLDALRLIGGETVAFKQVQILCGQCHGKLYAHWQAGAYGKRTGNWDGEKTFSLCTDCHDPHQPRFVPCPPDPAPQRPEVTLR